MRIDLLSTFIRCASSALKLRYIDKVIGYLEIRSD